MKTIEILPNISGLAVWTYKPETYLKYEEKKNIYYSSLGLLFSCKWKEDKNYFSCEIEQDWREVGKENKYGYCKGGTYGRDFKAKTIEEAIQKFEEYKKAKFTLKVMNGYVYDEKQEKHVPRYKEVTSEYTNEQMAELAWMHHNAWVLTLRESDSFWFELLEKCSKEKIDLFNRMVDKYKIRSSAEQKYKDKLIKCFEDTFNYSARDFVHQFRFQFMYFLKKIGKQDPSEFTKKENSVIKHMIKYFNI